MNKKLPVMPAAVRELEAARVAGLSVQPRLPLAELQGAIREGLMAFSCAAGRVVIAELMEAERTQIVGPKGRHDPDRVAQRNGAAAGSVVLGGRKVPISRPRAVHADGSGEVTLDSYAVFSSKDLLTQVALERMLAGVATRRQALVAEPIGEALEAVARGDSKSAVSRRFKTATEAKLAELLARDLFGLDVAAVMIDGIMFAECCCVVAFRRSRRRRRAPTPGVVPSRTPVPFARPGVYAIALDRDPQLTLAATQRCPIFTAAVEQLLSVPAELTLDGGRPGLEELARRIASFWIADETVLYVGVGGNNGRWARPPVLRHSAGGSPTPRRRLVPEDPLVFAAPLGSLGPDRRAGSGRESDAGRIRCVRVGAVTGCFARSRAPDAFRQPRVAAGCPEAARHPGCSRALDAG